MRAPRPANELIAVVETLGRHLTPAAVPTEPLAMILWENIGYLIDEARRPLSPRITVKYCHPNAPSLSES